jgi:hypothetical protein
MQEQETPEETPHLAPNPDAELSDEEINDVSGGRDMAPAPTL